MAIELKHPVRVGDIFVKSDTDEDGHSVGFYEVVRLKGKTMAELRCIKSECLIEDERCQRDESCCEVRPLPGQFYNTSPDGIIVTKVYYDPDDEWEKLYLSRYGRGLSGFYSPYDPDDTYYETGYWGGCQRALMKKAQELGK